MSEECDTPQVSKTRPYRVAAKIGEQGKLRLDELPFEEGERVEVVLIPLGAPQAAADGKRYPLHGAALRYDRPTGPVASAE